LLLASATSHTGDRLRNPFRVVRRKFLRANDCFRVPEDNEMVMRDGLLAVHKRLGMNLNLAVAASPAGAPTSSPATSRSTSPPTTKPCRTSWAAGPINC
jgi:hypothetical protein